MPVMKNPPRPGTPEWRSMITASKVPTMLGLSPWSSPYALWHEMYGGVEPTKAMDETDAQWSHQIEESIAQSWVSRQPEKWELNVGGEIAYTNPDLPFPNLATLDRRARRGRRFHIIECKTTRSLDIWGRPGDPDSVPLHYIAQVMFQMGVSGIHEASVCVHWRGPVAPEIHEVQWDEDVWETIVAACTRWHQTGIAGDPPPLDDRTATYDAVRGLHPDIDRDTDIQVDHDQAVALLDALEDEAAAKAAVVAAKTRLLDQMGTARRALVGDTTIATRTPGRGDSITLRINRKSNLT